MNKLKETNWLINHTARRKKMETMASVFISFAIGVGIYFFIMRPIWAIGDIPDEIRELRKAIEKLTKVIDDNGKDGHHI